MIGRGGFGVTYEAVNILTGQRTAIKEWKAGDRGGFLREARTLHDFASEEAVVTVLDYLEENDAAFLIMEYLDGITLREYIEENGKLPMESVVRLFEPVWEALERIHEAGIIHRDISPDNLMVLGQPGNIRLKLMDFGAARNYENANVTHSVIYKPSYSPPEQMDPEGVMGSYTDVYALCGTIYYCITGKAPEDVISRLLLDELEAPSSLGADIVPAAEKVLMKGMALECEERIQTVDSLAGSLRAIYPDLSEEEKKAEKLRRIKRRQRIAAAVAAAFVILLMLAFRYRVNLRFLFEETTSATLDGSDMSDEEFTHNASIVRERIDVFSEGWYLWKEDAAKKKVVFTVSTKLFGHTDPEEYICKALSRPMAITIRSGDNESGNTVDFGTFDKKTDFSEVSRTDDHVYVKFSDEAAARFDGLLNEKDRIILLCFDLEHMEEFETYTWPQLTYSFKTVGDGQRIYYDLISPEEALGMQVPPELGLLHLTQDTFEKFFSVYTAFCVRWEDPESAMIPGRMQMREDKVPGDTILFSYPLSSLTDADTADEAGQMYNSALISLQVILKNRLDAMEIPYAAGIDVYDNYSLIFKIPLNGLWYIEAEHLSEQINYQLDIGNQYIPVKDSLSSSISEIEVEDNPDGSYRLVLVPISLYKDDFIKAMETVHEQGSDLYLYFGGIPIASCPTESALGSLEKDGSIPFVKLALPGINEMNSQTRHFAAFLEAGLRQSPQQPVYASSVEAQFNKEQLRNNLHYNRIRSLMPDYLPHDQKDIAMRWHDRYGSENCEIRYSTKIPYSYFIDVSGCDLSDPKGLLTILTDIREKDADFLRDKKILQLQFTFRDLPVWEKDSHSVYVQYTLDFQSLTLQPDDTYVYGYEDGSEREKMTALWKEAVAKVKIQE